MKSDALSEQAAEPLAREAILLRRQGKRLLAGERGGNLLGEIFRRTAERSEHENRAEIGTQSIPNQSRPPTAHLCRDAIGEREQIDLFERHGAIMMGNQDCVATD